MALETKDCFGGCGKLLRVNRFNYDTELALSFLWGWHLPC